MEQRVPFSSPMGYCLAPAEPVAHNSSESLTTDWKVVACPDPTTHNHLVWKAEMAELLYTTVEERYKEREKELTDRLGFIFEWVILRLESDYRARITQGCKSVFCILF